MNALSPTFGIRLTQREKEIMHCITDGLNTSQIAAKLSISEYTVSNHRKNLIKKKGVKNTREIIKNLSANFAK